MAHLIALTLCVLGSGFQAPAATSEANPRSAGRPIDGAAALRIDGLNADVWLKPTTTPLLWIERLAAERQSTTSSGGRAAGGVPTRRPSFTERPASIDDYCFAVLNTQGLTDVIDENPSLTTQPNTIIRNQSDLARYGDTSTMIETYVGDVAGEFRFRAKIFRPGAGKRAKLRLYVWWAVLEKGGLAWQLKTKKDAPF